MKKKDLTKPHRSVFLLAAEWSVNSLKNEWCNVGYSCYRIERAAKHLEYNPYKELAFYQKLYNPLSDKRGQWWEDLPNGKWDNESRILALLLAAEVLRR